MWESWFTLVLIMVILIVLIRNMARPEYVFLAALAILVITGILTPSQALSGFTNQAVIAVGSLFLVAAAVHQTGALAFLEKLLLPDKTGTPAILLRLMGSTALMSAFLNNTPVVAMLIPQVQQWAARTNRNVSKYLIPLSYAAIIGGTVTLIGTSTNLIVSGLLSDRGYEPLGFFELTWIGLPAAVMVLIYFITIGHKTLPPETEAPVSKPVILTSPGKPGLKIPQFLHSFVSDIPFLPRFAWIDVQESSDDSYKHQSDKSFSINRNNLKELTLKQRQPSEDKPEHGGPNEHIQISVRSVFVLITLVTMITLAALGVFSIAISAFTAALLLIATGCLKPRKILKSLNLPILLVIAGAIGVGQAIDASGLAHTGGLLILDISSSFGFIAVIISIYLATNILTELITNNAAAVLMFPLAIFAAYEAGIDPHAAAVTVAMAASASFLTPFGYQTNLMIMDAGGYKVHHYLKAGVPVTLIVMSVTVLMVYIQWF